jgi:hypothetical protein
METESVQYSCSEPNSFSTQVYRKKPGLASVRDQQRTDLVPMNLNHRINLELTYNQRGIYHTHTIERE